MARFQLDSADVGLAGDHRVVSYFRPSDYAAWALGTAAFPALLSAYGVFALQHAGSRSKYFTELADPSGARRLPRGITPALRLATTLGFAGGFLLAYQRSSMRFWGWHENVRSCLIISVTS